MVTGEAVVREARPVVPLAKSGTCVMMCAGWCPTLISTVPGSRFMEVCYNAVLEPPVTMPWHGALRAARTSAAST